MKIKRCAALGFLISICRFVWGGPSEEVQEIIAMHASRQWQPLHEKTARYLKTYSEKASGSSEARYYFGVAKAENGDFKGGIAEMRTFLRQYPNDTKRRRAELCILDYLYRMSDSEGYLKEIDDAVLSDLSPEKAANLADFQAGMCLRQLGREREALKRLAKYAKENPNKRKATRATYEAACAADESGDWYSFKKLHQTLMNSPNAPPELKEKLNLRNILRWRRQGALDETIRGLEEIIRNGALTEGREAGARRELASAYLRQARLLDIMEKTTESVVARNHAKEIINKLKVYVAHRLMEEKDHKVKSTLQGELLGALREDGRYNEMLPLAQEYLEGHDNKNAEWAEAAIWVGVSMLGKHPGDATEANRYFETVLYTPFEEGEQMKESKHLNAALWAICAAQTMKQTAKVFQIQNYVASNFPPSATRSLIIPNK